MTKSILLMLSVFALSNTLVSTIHYPMKVCDYSSFEPETDNPNPNSSTTEYA